MAVPKRKVSKSRKRIKQKGNLNNLILKKDKLYNLYRICNHDNKSIIVRKHHICSLCLVSKD